MTKEISLTLPGNIVYVTGTVNGVDKTFTLKNGFWTTTAERVPEERYEISVLAVNSLGNSTRYETVLFYGIQLITDRTKDDVKNKTEKGYYNNTDLNRVETATRQIADDLTNYGYPIIIKTKNTWAMTDFPSANEMKRYLSNIDTCIRNFGLPKEMFKKPTDMNRLDYKSANQIEECLEKLDFY